MVHAAVTIFFALAGAVLQVPILAALCACFYLGREFTQAEYRWIAAYAQGKRENMPCWGGFDLRIWNRKSLFDWLLPVLVAVLTRLAV